MGRPAVAALGFAGVALGLLAEQQAYAWSGLRDWLPDLIAGWSMIGFGLWLAALRRSPGASVLLLAAGLAWFLPNFATTGPAALEWLAAHTTYLHRGPLFALALALPTGHARTRLAARGVALAWVAAVAWPLWDRDGSALLLCVALVSAAWAIWARSPGQHLKAIAGRGLAATALVCLVVAADAVRSLAGGAQTVTDATVLGYAVAVAVASAILFEAALRDAPESLAERAVGLGRSGATLQDALRDLLGDASLEIGADERTSLDRGLEVTPVVGNGGEIALLAHETGTLEDPLTRGAVLAVARMTLERDRLHAEVERQVDAMLASRRRLLLAEDHERARLAARIEDGPGAALADVDRHLREAASAAGADLQPALDRASGRLGHVRPELDVLARGLWGIDGPGLPAALEQLAVDVPIDCAVEVRPVEVPPEIATALWFVAAEALANTVKHAGAESVSVRLGPGDGGGAVLAVVDDGRGGADAGGTGLVGLADRVGALGGSLAVDSRRHAGTSVTASFPTWRSTRPLPVARAWSTQDGHEPGPQLEGRGEP